jgi:ankyrin repeat protein
MMDILPLVLATVLTAATPLLIAASKGDLEIVKLLISHGARVNLAARGYSEQRVARAALPERSLILQAEAARGDTPLLTAIRNDHRDVVDHLLANGANVNQPNRDTETPGLVAARLGDHAVHDQELGRHQHEGQRVQQAHGRHEAKLADERRGEG